MEAFFDSVLFNIGKTRVTVLGMIITAFTLVFLFLVYNIFRKWLIRYCMKNSLIAREDAIPLNGILFFILMLTEGLVIILFLNLDKVLYKNEFARISLSHVIQAIIIFQIARLIDFITNRLFKKKYQTNADAGYIKGTDVKKKLIRKEFWAGRTVQYLVYTFSIALILEGFKLDYVLFATKNNKIELTLVKIVWVLIVFFTAKLISWMGINFVLSGYYKRKKVEVGSQFAINQLFKYFVYLISFIFVLENIGVHMTVVWGGAAALLVGVGIGLQHTFNDLISGIILLFERTVEVNDVVEVENMVGRVKRIGIRTSLINTRDNTNIIVPNSKFILNSVINWNHIDDKVRFNVSLRIAYDSDVEMARKLLIDITLSQDHILSDPEPFVRLSNFGRDAIELELFFWSKELMFIEDVKSNIRFQIIQQFNENNIKIPMPQQEIKFRTNSPFDPSQS